MKIKNFLAICFILSSNSVLASTLQGLVYTHQPVVNSLIVINDAFNNKVTAKTDENGFYQVDITKLTAPLVIFSDNNSIIPINHFTDNACANNCIASFVNTLQTDSINIANINPFTDLIVSDIATKLGYLGPEQLINHGVEQPISSDILTIATDHFHQIFDNALTEIGIDAKTYNPITANEPTINKLFDVIIHNRGYDSNSGEISSTILLDMCFKPVNELSPLNYKQSLIEKNQNINAKNRIFIISDSTASNYDKKVYPRMGWGQVFDQFVTKESKAIVINGAQSGRSSRSFYNEGWYDLMAPFMQKGDYLIIAFGHNDEKCDNSKQPRGSADINNLCTYPNDINNHKQFPSNQPDMSFQTSLERYINLAKINGMIPILMTPVTRFRNENNKIAYQNNDTNPVVSTHYTQKKPGVLFSGNYADTVRYTAKKNNIPLIDLESLSINFANNHKDNWQNYWLAIDPNDNRYPYYKTQKSGTTKSPDITHFQEQGAFAIATIIANAINRDPALQKMPISSNNQVKN